MHGTLTISSGMADTPESRSEAGGLQQDELDESNKEKNDGKRDGLQANKLKKKDEGKERQQEDSVTVPGDLPPPSPPLEDPTESEHEEEKEEKGVGWRIGGSCVVTALNTVASGITSLVVGVAECS